MKLPEGEYFIYLRKSRADVDAENRGEGETLTKHKKALIRLARDAKVNVTRIYEEIASGESLMFRPQMLEMMRIMETDPPKGILVMEIDRLGRGNMQEQGLILDTFRRMNILIVTPRKTYDLNNEFDDEYSEFETFMARKESKLIKRRLQGGRERSAKEGNYVGTRPPYGFQLHITEKDERTLIPHPEQAEVIKLIFDLYEDMGATRIAKRLQEMGVPTYHDKKWNFNVILQILRNPVYIGRIQWKKTERKKTATKTENRRRGLDEIIDVNGRHEGIITEEVFERTQQKLKDNMSLPIREKSKIANPFAGLIKCGYCERSMIYKDHIHRGFATLVCNNTNCECRSTRFDVVEKRIIEGLEVALKDYKVSLTQKEKKPSSSKNVLEQRLKESQVELAQYQVQKDNLHNLLERGIYDDETYLKRSKEIADCIKVVSEQIEKMNTDLLTEKNKDQTKLVIPKVKKVLDSYHRAKDAGQKNQLMKTIIKKVIYTKSKSETLDSFTIQITLKESLISSHG